MYVLRDGWKNLRDRFGPSKRLRNTGYHTLLLKAIHFFLFIIILPKPFNCENAFYAFQIAISSNITLGRMIDWDVVL